MVRLLLEATRAPLDRPGPDRWSRPEPEPAPARKRSDWETLVLFRHAGTPTYISAPNPT